MTIDRSLYIVTEQIKQDTDHKISIMFVGFNPQEANHALRDRTKSWGVGPTYSYVINRVKLNKMGASDVQVIDYSELITDARTF